MSSTSLRQIDPKTVSDVPELKIKTEEDLSLWSSTSGYRDFRTFLRGLSDSVAGHFLPVEGEPCTKAIAKLLTLLETLDGWIDEIPPHPTPQRFGNLAFRTWGQCLEERADALLLDLTSSTHTVSLLKHHLLTSFGSFTRMDYGTGHETAFALFLMCLTLVRFVNPVPEEERDLVLRVFVRYLRLCWRLQDVYRLEPAGSHGVWGLDDYTFLSYVFGSGQLRDQTEIPVDSVLNPPLLPTNLYNMSIMRIRDVKTGAFHEHSSQLYSIATSVPNWGKLNSGLFKMYEAEVLGKRVVVQHLALGGLVEWDVPQREKTMAPPATAAPWASTGTPAPWATSASRNEPPAGITAATMAPWGMAIPTRRLP